MKVYTLPFTILIDQREKLPFDFTGYEADKKYGGGEMIVPHRTAFLESGDYTIEGFEDRIALERKGRNDCFSTIGQGRERFERELTRLNAMAFAAVVVEDSLAHILTSPPVHSHLDPKTVFRSVIAWQQRFTRVHWMFCDERRLAEAYTLRALERFWREQQVGREKVQQVMTVEGTLGLPD